jgi:excisionase family DNA binding protein
MSLEDIELTPRQVADFFGYHLQTVRQFIKKGKLISRKLGPRTYRLAYADVLRFQRDHVIPNTGRGRPKKNRAEEVPA